jgi:drug/metabolite transporter, DME family
MNERLPHAILAVSALAFGFAYPVIRDSIPDLGAAGAAGWRLLAGGAFLLALAFPTQARVWRDGSVGGLWLFAAFSLQALALERGATVTTAALVGSSAVLAPIATAALKRSTPGPWVVIGAVLGFVGVVLVGLGDRFGLERSHVLALASALLFAGHLAHLARTAARHVLVPYAGVHLTVAGLVAVATSLLTGGPGLPPVSSLPSVAVAGLALGALPVLGQMWCQSRLGAGRTALGLTMVPLGAAMGAVGLSGERLPAQGWLGVVVLVTAAVVVTVRGQDPEVLMARSVSPGH